MNKNKSIFKVVFAVLKFWNKLLVLDNTDSELSKVVINPFLANYESITKQRKCFESFVLSHLDDLKPEIQSKFQNHGFVCISAPEAWGLKVFTDNLSQSISSKYDLKTVFIKTTTYINTTEQIALAILNEVAPEEPPENRLNALAKLKLLCDEQKLFVVIENVQNITSPDLNGLLDNLEKARVLLLGPAASSFRFGGGLRSEIIEIPLLTNEQSLDLANSLLNFRNDLILTTANREELVALVNLCGRLPEVIYSAFSSSPSKNNMALAKYYKQITASVSNSHEQHYMQLMKYKLEQLPTRVESMLVLAYYLPVNGFTQQDLYIVGESILASVEELEVFLDFLTINFFVQKTAYGALEEKQALYYLPEFVRRFIKENLLNKKDKAQQKLIEKANYDLLQRLDSSKLWNTRQIWLTQLELGLRTAKWVQDNKAFTKNKYNLLILQSYFSELGFWQELENKLIPLAAQAINHADNNDDRGFWYGLTGLMYRALSRFANQEANLNAALLFFQKSLKFYDPNREASRYCGIYKNIGQIYFELAMLIQNDPLNLSSSDAAIESKSEILHYLKLAIKSFHKALNQVELAKNKTTLKQEFAIKKLMAQVHRELARREKPGENCFKAFGLYNSLLKTLNSPSDEVKNQIILGETAELSALVKNLNTQVDEIEKVQLTNLSFQIDGLLVSAV